MTRITNLTQHQTNLQNIFDTQRRMFRSQEQVSSGKVAQNYAGVAVDASQLVELTGERYRAEQFEKNNQAAIQRLQSTDVVVNSLVDTATLLRTRLTQRVDAAASGNMPLDVEVQALLDDVVGQLNRQENGRFIFAGAQTSTKPVELDPAFAAFGGSDTTYYQGDDVALTVRADDGLSVDYGVTADNPAFQKLIGALRSAIEGHQTNDIDLLRTSLALATDAVNSLADLRAEVGAKMSVLEQANDRHTQFRSRADEIAGTIIDADIPQAMTELAQNQLALEASFATVSRLQNLSLLDYLR